MLTVHLPFGICQATDTKRLEHFAVVQKLHQISIAYFFIFG